MAWNCSLRSASEISGIERTLLNFRISVVYSEFAKEEAKHSRFTDFEIRGRKFSISIPLNLLAVD